MNTSPFIKWFADITIDDVPLVGGKNASLGEMVRELASKGVKVPDGFAITAEAYRHFIREAGSTRASARRSRISTPSDMANLSQRGHAVRQAILNATLPARSAGGDRGGLSSSCRVTAKRRSMSPCAPRPRPKICRMRASPASRRPISTSRAPPRCWRPASAALPRSSPTAPSATAWTRASIISRSRSASACSAWCAPTSPAPASCSPSTPRPASAMRC